MRFIKWYETELIKSTLDGVKEKLLNFTLLVKTKENLTWLLIPSEISTEKLVGLEGIVTK
jgi:hypothetical protein